MTSRYLLTGVFSGFFSCRVPFNLPSLPCTNLLLLLRKQFWILGWEDGFDELLDLSRPSASCGLRNIQVTNLGASDTNLEKVGILGRVFLVNFSGEPPEDGADHRQILR